LAYPSLGLAAARILYTAREAKTTPPRDVDATLYKPGADFDEARGIDCLNQCCDLALTARDSDWSAARFDGQLARLLHGALNLSSIVAGDSDFWRWFTFSQGGLGVELVDRRYGGQRGKLRWSDFSGPARPVYYGLGELKKGMFAKLWICANAMYIKGAADPYDGIDYPDVDLWDSHVIDVNFGSSAVMARAFVKVVRDGGLRRGEPSDPNGQAGFRDLAKEIRRRQATVVFEMFDDQAARRWVEDLWRDRKSWSGKR